MTGLFVLHAGHFFVFSSVFHWGCRDKKLSVAAQHLPPVTCCSADADSSISDAFYIHFTSQTPTHESCVTAAISTIDYVLFSQVSWWRTAMIFSLRVHYFIISVSLCACWYYSKKRQRHEQLRSNSKPHYMTDSQDSTNNLRYWKPRHYLVPAVFLRGFVSRYT